MFCDMDKIGKYYFFLSRGPIFDCIIEGRKSEDRKSKGRIFKRPKKVMANLNSLKKLTFTNFLSVK